MAKKQSEQNYSYSRYVFVGAVLGLYFGLFYNPQDRDLNLVTPVLLAIVVAVIMTILFCYPETAVSNRSATLFCDDLHQGQPGFIHPGRPYTAL